MKKVLALLLLICVLCVLLASCSIGKTAITGTYTATLMNTDDRPADYELIIGEDMSFILRVPEREGYDSTFSYSGTVEFNSKSNTGYFFVEEIKSDSTWYQDFYTYNDPMKFEKTDSGNIVVVFDTGYSQTYYRNGVNTRNHAELFIKQ